MATNLNALTLRINASTDGVSRAVKAVRSDVNRINGILRRNATATERAKQAQESLNRVYRTGAISAREFSRAKRAIKKEFTETEPLANRAAASLKRVAVALVGIRTAQASIRNINESFGRIDKLAKTADKLGVATDKLVAYRLAAEETAGMMDGQFDTALQRMTRRTAEAAQGTGEARAAIRELGLDAAQLNRMSPDQMFAAYAEAFRGIRSESDRLRLAFKLFDSEGAGLVNTLKIGKAGLDDYEEAARRLGISISRVDAAKIERANDAIGRIRKSIQGVKDRITIGLAPAIEMAAKKFESMSLSSEASTERISAGLRRVAKVVGFVANGIDVWKRIFASVRFGVTKLVAVVAERVQWLADKVTELMNRIPFVKAESMDYFGTLAEKAEKAAAKARYDAAKEWSRPLPSVAIDQWFNKLDARIEKSRKDFEKVTQAQQQADQFNQSYGSQFERIGAAIAGTVNRVSGNLNRVLEATKVQQASQNATPDQNTALRGSRAEFELLRQMQSRENNKELALQKQQAALLGGIKGEVSTMAASIRDGFTKMTDELRGIDFGGSV